MEEEKEECTERRERGGESEREGKKVCSHILNKGLRSSLQKTQITPPLLSSALLSFPLLSSPALSSPVLIALN